MLSTARRLATVLEVDVARAIARAAFVAVVRALQTAAACIAPVDSEQAHALLQDSIAMQLRGERFARGLMSRRPEND